jgi:outer membrane immunogenic protein
MSLRALLVAVMVSGAAVVSVYAADQSVPGGSYYGARAYYPTSINWTGWYTGLQVGGAFASASWTDPFSNQGDDPKPNSVMGGGQFGVNWTQDSWLLGAEADFTWTDLSGSATDGAGFTHKVETNWMSLVTGRVGYATGRYLFYAKGGAAFANERNKVTSPVGAVANSGTTTQYGWTVGAGVEYAIDTNWSARLEYDFVDLPSRNLVLVGSQPGRVGPALGSQPATIDYNIHKVVGAINYRF